MSAPLNYDPPRGRVTDPKHETDAVRMDRVATFLSELARVHGIANAHERYTVRIGSEVTSTAPAPFVVYVGMDRYGQRKELWEPRTGFLAEPLARAFLARAAQDDEKHAAALEYKRRCELSDDHVAAVTRAFGGREHLRRSGIRVGPHKLGETLDIHLDDLTPEAALCVLEALNTASLLPPVKRKPR